MQQHLNKASAAKRLLDDPAFRASTESLEASIVAQLKKTQLDGKASTQEYVLELVRLLQTGARYQTLLWNQVDAGKLADRSLEQKKAFRSGGI